jgi:hypothetical protein
MPTLEKLPYLHAEELAWMTKRGLLSLSDLILGNGNGFVQPI